MTIGMKSCRVWIGPTPVAGPVHHIDDVSSVCFSGARFKRWVIVVLWNPSSYNNSITKSRCYTMCAACTILYNPRQGTLPAHALSRPRRVSGYLVGQWRLVCLNNSVRRKMVAGLYASRAVEMAYEWTGPVIRGYCVKSGEWRFTLDTRL